MSDGTCSIRRCRRASAETLFVVHADKTVKLNLCLEHWERFRSSPEARRVSFQVEAWRRTVETELENEVPPKEGA